MVIQVMESPSAQTAVTETARHVPDGVGIARGADRNQPKDTVLSSVEHRRTKVEQRKCADVSLGSNRQTTLSSGRGDGGSLERRNLQCV